MRICELGDGDGGLVWQQEGVQEASGGGELVRLKAKRALVGAGARVLFYPTLLYNVLRNRFEADFRWWDRVDQVLTLPSFCSTWTLWLVVFWMDLEPLGSVETPRKLYMCNPTLKHSNGIVSNSHLLAVARSF